MLRASSFFVASAVTMAMAGALAEQSEAQSGKAVYPAYDGLVRNDDGTVTVAFAYFNHNVDPVTIPAGPENSFAGDRQDRNQPTVFFPGHNRFVCSMVVDADFNLAGLRWSLTYAGTTTKTTEVASNVLWVLEERSAKRSNRGIDTATVPRGVCINRPPTVSVGGSRFGGGGSSEEPPARDVTPPDELELEGRVQDEGLPRGSAVTTAWKQLSGPGTVTFVNASRAATRAAFSAVGTYELELSASDSELESTAVVKVQVTSSGNAR